MDISEETAESLNQDGNLVELEQAGFCSGGIGLPAEEYMNDAGNFVPLHSSVFLSHHSNDGSSSSTSGYATSSEANSPDVSSSFGMDNRVNSVAIHKLLPVPAAFSAPVRFKNQNYYGISVDVNRMVQNDGEVLVSVKSKYPERFLRNWGSRKNKNPLKTRVTVRQLKELITNHSIQCGEHQNSDSRENLCGSSSSNATANLESRASVTESTESPSTPVRVSTSSHGSSTDPATMVASPTSAVNLAHKPAENLLSTVMSMSGLDSTQNQKRNDYPIILSPPAPTNKRRKHCGDSQQSEVVPVPKRKSNKSMIEKLAFLEIGSFQVDNVSDFRQARLRIFWNQRCFAYEMDTELRKKVGFQQGNTALLREIGTGDSVYLVTTMVISFDQIAALHFRPLEMFVRVRSPPKMSLGLEGYDGGSLVSADLDITNGEASRVFVHKLQFPKQRGACIQHALLSYDENFFGPLMTDLNTLLDEGEVIDGHEFNLEDSTDGKLEFLNWREYDAVESATFLSPANEESMLPRDFFSPSNIEF